MSLYKLQNIHISSDIVTKVEYESNIEIGQNIGDMIVNDNRYSVKIPMCSKTKMYDSRISQLLYDPTLDPDRVSIGGYNTGLHVGNLRTKRFAPVQIDLQYINNLNNERMLVLGQISDRITHYYKGRDKDGRTIYVCIAGYRNQCLYKSYDLKTWQRISMGVTFTSDLTSDIVYYEYQPGKFAWVVAGNFKHASEIKNNFFYISEDLENWVKYAINPTGIETGPRCGILFFDGKNLMSWKTYSDTVYKINISKNSENEFIVQHTEACKLSPEDYISDWSGFNDSCGYNKYVDTEKHYCLIGFNQPNTQAYGSYVMKIQYDNETDSYSAVLSEFNDSTRANKYIIAGEMRGTCIKTNGTLYIGTTNGYIYKSTNDGSTFIQIRRSNIADGFYDVIEYDGQLIFCGYSDRYDIDGAVFVKFDTTTNIESLFDMEFYSIQRFITDTYYNFISRDF